MQDLIENNIMLPMSLLPRKTLSIDNDKNLICDWPIRYKTKGDIYSDIEYGVFEISFDCQPFEENEINVTIYNYRLNIQCSHKDKKKSLFCYRNVERTYKLPQIINPKTLKKQLSDDGELIITLELVT